MPFWGLVFACPAPPPFGHGFSSLPGAVGLAIPFFHLHDQVGMGPGSDQPQHPVFQGPDSSWLVGQPRISYVLEPTGVPAWGYTILELLMLVPPASSSLS